MKEANMKRWRALTPGILIFLIFLGGCMSTVTPPADPYPYSFTDTSKQPYPKTVAGAQRFISDARTRWYYETNQVVLSPEFCATYFRGDCNDFATMLAYYLQQYWTYDTVIVFLDMDPNPYNIDGHAVCFIYPNDGLIDTSDCTMPTVLYGGHEYYPLDWYACPGWIWASYGGTVDFIPRDEIRYYYSYIFHDYYEFNRDGGFVEWYEMVGLAIPAAQKEVDGWLEPIPTVKVISPETIYLLAIGGHENFYRNLKD